MLKSEFEGQIILISRTHFARSSTTIREEPVLLKRCFRVLAACCLLLGSTAIGLAGPQNKTKTDEDIAALKKHVQALEEGQQQILQELRELKKQLQTKAVEPIRAAPVVATLNVKGEPFKGDQSARIAIVEYSDFECPFCGKYTREIYPQIIDRYVKTGKVRYYFRDLPLPIHANAMPAAIAARCAGDQGKFWEMHDSLFAHQSALSPKDFADRAATLGLDQAKFSDCIGTAKYGAAIRKVVAGARQMGIDGTPAFAIGTVGAGGEVVTISQVALGADSFEEFKTILDEILSSAPAK
jgi:protein-disulfide isomerase